MNTFAIAVAALSSFLLGGLWYSKVLFGPRWNAANGGQTHSGHPAKVFGISFVFSLIAAAAFCFLLGPAPELQRAVLYGLIAGFGIAATSFGINYQFANRSIALWLIDAGYHTLQFMLFGVVFGLWH